MRFCFGLIWFCLSLTAFARTDARPTPKLLFGPEFTFAMADRPVGEDPRYRMVQRMYEHLVQGQPEGARFTTHGEFEVSSTYTDEYSDAVRPIDKLLRRHFVSPNGWSFKIELDPGVIEVTMNPMTAETIQHFAADIQDAIFTSAANAGNFPSLYTGGGHINVGIEALIARPLLLRNFIVDLFNHGELFMGVFSYDTNNALPFSLFDPRRQNDIAEAVARFDSRQTNIEDFLSEVYALSCSFCDDFRKAWFPTSNGSRGKNVAIYFRHAREGNASRRFEIRAVRPQASAFVWARQTELLQKRLEYIDRFTTPIPLRPEVRLVEPLVPTMEQHALNPPVHPQKALEAFHRYVAESGLSWQDHRGYVWPAWLSSGEVKRYERSEAFRRIQRRACERVLLR